MRRRIKRPKRVVEQFLSYNSKEGLIEYLLKRSSARRTLSICIDENAAVVVSVPFNIKIAEVHFFLEEKALWIFRSIASALRNENYLKSRAYENGHEFLYLGKKYVLDISEGDVKRVRIDFDGAKWNIIVPENLSNEESARLVRRKLISWYRLQATEVLGGRIFHHSRIMGLTPKKIAVRSQKRMWGCCDYNKQTIHLNWQIILSPMAVIDYVVVHEMCHLVVPNHSKRFWKMVHKHMPDYEIYRKWLKNNWLDMVLPK